MMRSLTLQLSACFVEPKKLGARQQEEHCEFHKCLTQNGLCLTLHYLFTLGQLAEFIVSPEVLFLLGHLQWFWPLQSVGKKPSGFSSLTIRQ